MDHKEHVKLYFKQWPREQGCIVWDQENSDQEYDEHSVNISDL